MKSRISNFQEAQKRTVAENKTLKTEMDKLQTNFRASVKAHSSAYLDALLNIVQLPSDDCGVVVGVMSQPELNGSVIQCLRWHEDKQRWQVRTADGKDILLKNENILRRTCPDDEDSLSSRGESMSSSSDSEPT